MLRFEHDGTSPAVIAACKTAWLASLGLDTIDREILLFVLEVREDNNVVKLVPSLGPHGRPLGALQAAYVFPSPFRLEFSPPGIVNRRLTLAVA